MTEPPTTAELIKAEVVTSEQVDSKRCLGGTFRQAV